MTDKELKKLSKADLLSLMLAMSGSVNPIAGGIGFVVLIYFCIKLQKEASRKIADLIKQNNENAGTDSIGEAAGTLD